MNVIEPEGVSFNRNLPTNDPEHLAQSELLLVTLKAWQVSSAVSALLPKLNPQCAILLLHDGHPRELPPNGQPILQGTTTHAARHEGSTIIHVATGITHIGPSSPAAQHLSHLAEVLHQALPTLPGTTTSPRPTGASWRSTA